ncbi:MAG: hypothetical protein LDL20_07110, partial [Klebsiella quasipneumoniae]|nr:hypothetical protein [Klebsiella quasipneumoniae]
RINIHHGSSVARILAVRIRTYLDEAKLLSYGKKVAVTRQRSGVIDKRHSALPGAAKTHKCAGDQRITL